MRKLNLTSKRVQRLQKRPGRYRDDAVKGLLLVVTESKAKGDKPGTTASWQLRYQLHHKEHWLGLGSVADFKLAQARERARAARQLLADKRDPLEERRKVAAAEAAARAKTMTFAQCATQFFNQHEKGWRSPRNRQQFTATMRDYVLPVFGPLPVGEITKDLVLKVLEPHWATKRVTMKRVRARIEQVLSWAAARDLRSSENPARWGLLKELLSADKVDVEHHPEVPYRQIPTFMTKLRACKGVAPQALEFLILTASRTGEVLGATWDEVDLAAATWSIPGQRMKSGRTHRVALSSRAVEILRRAYRLRGCPYVFVGPNGRLSNMALSKELRRLEPDVTVHGFRASFKTWAEETTSFPNAIIEGSLAHKIADAVEASYLRSDLIDKRARLMEAWAAYCTSPPVEGGEVVVPLRAAT